MSSVLGKRKRISSKPSAPRSARLQDLVEALSVERFRAMVSCTECINHGVECYYDREQSVKCAACLRYQRDCDGTFSLQEFRRVKDERKRVEEQSRKKRREIQQLRKALVKASQELLSAEDEDNDLQDHLARLDDISSRMVKREMMALGVFETLSDDQPVLLADNAFSDWPVIPESGPVDWDQMLVLQASLTNDPEPSTNNS